MFSKALDITLYILCLMINLIQPQDPPYFRQSYNTFHYSTDK